MAKPNDTIAVVVTVLLVSAFAAFYLAARCLRPVDDSSTYLSTSAVRSPQPNYSAHPVEPVHSRPRFPRNPPPVQLFNGVPPGPPPRRMGGPFPPPPVFGGMGPHTNVGNNLGQGIGRTHPDIVDVQHPGSGDGTGYHLFRSESLVSPQECFKPVDFHVHRAVWFIITLFLSLYRDGKTV
ncbi:hypothetical protein F5Y19DRAFT_482005 [Xylariaceae sp. FL1651]|nr:hypothetical protein F5Y19DRAFT_482005 [Xylariaceae sp. FL1651]